MKAQTVEDLLQNQIAACLAATEDCLAQSRLPETDDDLRGNELDYITKLMKASARLTGALAQLRGDRVHRIHVTRAGQGDKGTG